MSVFTHRGPWNEASRQSPALRFIEQYASIVDSLDLSTTPYSAFYSPSAIFHDTNGDVYTSGPQIWEWMKRLFSPFDKPQHELVEVRVISETDESQVVYDNFLTHFRLKGDVEEIVVPRLIIFTIGKADGEDGTDGLQIHGVNLFWDTGVLGRYVTERKRKCERKQLHKIDAIIN